MDVGRRELAGLVVLAAVALAAAVTSPERALSALVALGDRPPLFAAVLLVVYLLRPFVAWPTMAVSAVVGVVLGPVVGLPVALLGAVVTSLPPFYLGERFRTDEGVAGRVADGGRAYFGAAGNVRGVTAARLAPVPADAVSVTAGLSGVSLWAYAAGTLVGELPWTVAAVVLGTSARTVAAAGLDGLELPLLAATTLAALVLLAGPLYRALGGVPSAE
jgi:uncharacterized membrane protein YdjX (TVP38/TMEM64 family)